MDVELELLGGGMFGLVPTLQADLLNRNIVLQAASIIPEKQ